MTINYPENYSLGSEVKPFPKKQYEKIVEIIEAVNTNTAAISALPVTALKYKALLSQSGASAPVATVVENTLGGTLVWTYNSTGVYIATLVGAFTENKTLISPIEAVVSAGEKTPFVRTVYWDSDSIRIKTFKMAGDPLSETLANGLLYLSYISIEVYP
jgi:hypothetical protein